MINNNASCSNQSYIEYTPKEQGKLQELVAKNIRSNSNLNGTKLSLLPVNIVVNLGTFKNLSPARLKIVMDVLEGWGKKSVDKPDFFKELAKIPASAEFLYRFAEDRGYQHAKRALKAWGFKKLPMDIIHLDRFASFFKTPKGSLLEIDHKSSLKHMIGAVVQKEVNASKPSVMEKLPPWFAVDCGVFEDLSNEKKAHRALNILNEWGEKKVSMLIDTSATTKVYYRPLPKNCYRLACYAEKYEKKYPYALKQLKNWGMKAMRDEMFKELTSENQTNLDVREFINLAWVLMKRGVNPSIVFKQNGNEETMFSANALYPQYHIIDSLVELGAHLDSKSVFDAVVSLAFEQGEKKIPDATKLKQSFTLIQTLLKHSGVSILDKDQSNQTILHRMISLIGAQIPRGSRSIPSNIKIILLFLSRLDPTGQLLKQKNATQENSFEWGKKCHGVSRDGRYTFDDNVWSLYKECDVDTTQIKEILSTPYNKLDATRVLDKVRLERAFDQNSYPNVELPEDISDSEDFDYYSEY